MKSTEKMSEIETTSSEIEVTIFVLKSMRHQKKIYRKRRHPQSLHHPNAKCDIVKMSLLMFSISANCYSSSKCDEIKIFGQNSNLLCLDPN